MAIFSKAAPTVLIKFQYFIETISRNKIAYAVRTLRAHVSLAPKYLTCRIIQLAKI
jgi:hypothetical protein